ncbi:gamma-glutamyltransferase [Acididesulfobacillus acetoxydans]|uniref:Acylase ACY 1 n=1 Tax=Acididesulfobacillus acetoxydans TaxID=1561005 RepID=A0A8S0XVS0_9FIRM|nr:gamma-glutamyltransferase family protein [Acididesulfobacillus acetoxydans]CAA7600547.1 gamma-glutamyltransferase [Acididesulfobacillus acetoxydans]CEJ06681.1 Acylase ACY 1 [Acididesulfobacillus acetoxydans]
MHYDPLFYPYASRRTTVYARNGMVATSQPLAAQAGLEVLRRGGNAIDAAVAAATTLTVVEPTSNGIGGDAFALLWAKGKLYGLNASGPAPHKLSAQTLTAKGWREIPKHGWLPVTVPGAPAAWAELSRRFGRLPLADVMQPAVTYADEGYPISPTLGYQWSAAFDTYRRELKGDEFKSWFETFAPRGRAPKIGEIWRSPDHARTLRLIAETEAETFYRGTLAEKIDDFSRQQGGYLRLEDLAAFRPEWAEPIKVDYRGYQVWEIPPNGHGLVALMALNILNGLDLPEKDSAERYHLCVEAMKLAYADGRKFIAEPGSMRVRVKDLLSPAYAEERRKLIGREALEPEPGRLPQGGTVYLATADKEGNMVSYIQSNYMGFGSGLVVPGTGISLHNRGCNFSLEPDHANVLAPGKRPYHTIIPGFLTRGGSAVGPFGVMGGFMQPQGHLQVMVNALDFHLNPQAALDAPRWQWLEGKTVELEHSVPEHTAESLARRGHRIVRPLGSGSFGRGQIIWRNEDGVLAGAAEPRTDGQVAAW